MKNVVKNAAGKPAVKTVKKTGNMLAGRNGLKTNLLVKTSGLLRHQVVNGVFGDREARLNQIRVNNFC